MEKIKEQINGLIGFKEVKTLDEAVTMYKGHHERIQEGLKRMKDIGVFSEDEIKDVSNYAYWLRNVRYEDCVTFLKEEMRNNFVF